MKKYARVNKTLDELLEDQKNKLAFENWTEGL